jgi:O-antigen/teichoic acid export membrane protein
MEMFKIESFWKNVGIMAGGTAASQAIVILATPLLTRIYSTESYGILQIYQSLLIFFIVIASWKYEFAIILPEDDGDSFHLLVLSLCLVCLMSILTLLLFWFISSNFPAVLKFDALRQYLWLIPLTILGAGGYQALNYWTVREKNYTLVSKTRITQSISQILTQFIVGLLCRGCPLGLLLGDLFGRTSGSISLALSVWRKRGDMIRNIRIDQLIKVANRYRRFPLISTGSTLINTAGFAFPSLLLGHYYGFHVVGCFALVERVMNAPATLIGQSVSQVYSREAAAIVSSGTNDLLALYLKTSKKLLLIGFFPFIIIIVGGPQIFSFVFGESWRQAGEYARILAVMHYVSFVIWPQIPTLNILEKQGWQLEWDLVRLTLTIGAIFVAKESGWSADVAIFLYGAAMLIGYVLHFFLSYRAIKQYQKS